jgi:5-methylcytosine-specific restriction enzyme A
MALKRHRMTKTRATDAQAYHALYESRRWRALRAALLTVSPLCERCQARGQTTPALIAHHRTPHRGDLALFLCGVEGLEAMCVPCHNSLGQQEDKRGYTNEIADDGWPIHPNQPANRVR